MHHVSNDVENLWMIVSPISDQIAIKFGQYAIINIKYHGIIRIFSNQTSNTAQYA